MPARKKTEEAVVKLPKKTTKVKAEVSAVISMDPTKSEKTKRVTGPSVDLYDLSGKVTGKVTLPAVIFAAKENKPLVAQAVRVYLANQRKGTVSTKSRGEVQGSTRKIYRQKGTGRARHGSNRAPIFVHGGVAFGPKPRDYSLKLPQKMKRVALFSALSAKVKDGEIKVISGLASIEPKTKVMAQLMKQLSSDAKKRNVLLITEKDTENISRAAKNLEGISYTAASRLNVYDVLTSKMLILMQESVAMLEKTFIVSK